MRLLLQVLIGVVLLSIDVAAFRQFVDVIPNGNNVPHPCLDNYLWAALGHENAEGAGPRNPFGNDFDRNGKVWNKCLCEQDSDGDGRTNGEELGDPGCVWTPGQRPNRTEGLTHPGVCEPLNSDMCREKNTWEFCELEEFVCDAINEPDVVAIPIQFPLTPVPPTETNYFCMNFELPLEEDQDYHMIAVKPILNNTIVEHHILVFGCNEQNGQVINTTNPPQSCGMDSLNCPSIIGLWSVGSDGQCFSEEFGFKLGPNGYRKVMMQVHWNNPALRDDYLDAPGMYMYATKNLRANDAGVLMVGTQGIFIPPGSPSYGIEGRCSSECTNSIPHNLILDSVMLHMHYLGLETGFTHSRDGKLLHMTYEKHYSYDSPEVYKFEEPLNFRPGDEMAISCKYQSRNKDTMTRYGDGTSDEMCFAFVVYYPKLPVHIQENCFSFKSLSLCPANGYAIGNCDFLTFFNETTFAKFGVMQYHLNAVCNVTGASPDACPEGCLATIESIRSQDPCLQGDAGLYVELNIFALYDGLREISQLMHICDADWDQTWQIPREFVTDNNTKNRTIPVAPPPGDDDDFCVFDATPPPSSAVSLALSSLVGMLALVAHFARP